MTAIVKAFPNTGGELIVFSEFSEDADQNRCMPDDVALAVNRGWRVFKYSADDKKEDYTGYVKPSALTTTGFHSAKNIEGIYDLAGRRLPQLRRGVNVVKYHAGTVRKVVKA